MVGFGFGCEGFCAICLFVCLFVFKPPPVAAVQDKAGENVAAAPVQAKLSDQDKVQWLTDRIAHSVTDLIRTRPDGKEAADRPRTATDNDVRSTEQPGKVTG